MLNTAHQASVDVTGEITFPVLNLDTLLFTPHSKQKTNKNNQPNKHAKQNTHKQKAKLPDVKLSNQVYLSIQKESLKYAMRLLFGTR